MKWCWGLLLILFLILISSCSHVFYQPSSYYYSDPGKEGLAFENLYFNSFDGETRLHAWLMKAKHHSKDGMSKGLVLHFHGNAENISSHFRGFSWMAKAGYDVLIFDYRGYGRSQGEPDQQGLYLDALAALRFACDLQEKSKTSKLIVIGQSLGGIVAMRALADFKDRSRVTLIVMDASFSSYQSMAFNKLTHKWYMWPVSPLAYLLISDSMESASFIPQLDRPLLVVHGKKDLVVPAKFGQEIYDLAPKSIAKWYWEDDEAEHIQFFNGAHAEANRQKLLTLIENL